jgi:hypothetical protein
MDELGKIQDRDMKERWIGNNGHMHNIHLSERWSRKS